MSLYLVLNLIITGIPSILNLATSKKTNIDSFKPYYNWNTFNTLYIISTRCTPFVLNLIITGIPSILGELRSSIIEDTCFKPYYNWNTFNT